MVRMMMTLDSISSFNEEENDSGDDNKDVQVDIGHLNFMHFLASSWCQLSSKP